jgi:membrane protease YdiL (CAAX protease family)
MRLNAALIFGNREFVQRSEWKWWSGFLAGTLAFLISSFIGIWMVFSSTVGRVSDLGIITVILTSQIVLIAALVFLARWTGSGCLAKLYLVPANLRGAWVIAFIAIALGVWCTDTILANLFPEAMKGDGQSTYEDLRSADTRLAAIAMVVIGAPISEELLFRGFMLPPLAKTRLGFWGATFVTSLLWTAIIGIRGRAHWRSWYRDSLFPICFGAPGAFFPQ